MESENHKKASQVASSSISMQAPHGRITYDTSTDTKWLSQRHVQLAWTEQGSVSGHIES